MDARILYGGVGFLGLGMLGMVRGVRALVRGLGTHRWSTTPGVIAESRLQEVERGKSLSRQYRAVLSYSYEVAGKRWVGHDLRVGGDGIFGRRQAERRISRYPLHMAVDVYYDPSSPCDAVLEPGVPMVVPLGIVVGVSCVVVGALLLTGVFHT